MTDHRFTPPPELLKEWITRYEKHSWDLQIFADLLSFDAAQWGADQELEACCEWVYNSEYCQPHAVLHLRAARRPKPPSLKEQALLAIDVAVADGRLSPDVSNVVRRALEQLDG